MTYILQTVYAYSYTPSQVVPFTDVVLNEPTLVSPANGDQICKFANNSDTIELSWQTVTGASHYVVQWCRNSQFVGPTADARRVTAPTVTLELDVGTDLYYGETYYWRVYAYSANGASPKSQVFSFAVKCPDWGNKDTSECTDKKVKIVLTSATIHDCNSDSVVTAEYTFNPSLQLSHVEWTVTGNAEVVDSSNNSITLKAFGCNDNTISVELCLVFVGDLECCESISISVGCKESRVEYTPYSFLVDIIRPDSLNLYLDQDGLWLTAYVETYKNYRNYCNYFVDFYSYNTGWYIGKNIPGLYCNE